VIPNGVNAHHYSAAKIAEARRYSGENNPKPTLLFVGSMDYHPNVDAVTWFSLAAWPEVARNHPDLQFTIVGRQPSPAVQALASERIRVTGTVDDVRPFYASALAAVVPLRSGSGTRLKILEAMAAGVPVVSTRLGAEGIEAEDEVHLLLADNGAEIAAAIGRLASSATLRSRLSKAGRELVTAKYDWPVIANQLSEIHTNLVAPGRNKPLQTVS
jgi:glycosyltransferase involved in cell wall biosynthesis